MNRINILIPAADGHALAWETIQSIAMQSSPCNVVILSRPRAHSSDAGLIRASEAGNRNLLKQYASDPFVFYCDSDVVFTSNSDVSDSIKFLIENPDWDAVALNTKESQNINMAMDLKHVPIACVCIRTSALREYTFTGNHDECCCIDFNKKLKIRYLDDRKLIEVKRK